MTLKLMLLNLSFINLVEFIKQVLIFIKIDFTIKKLFFIYTFYEYQGGELIENFLNKFV